jgi:hypothetical protein
MVNAKLFKSEKKYLSAKDDGEKLNSKVLTIDTAFSEDVQNPNGEVKTSLCIRFKDVEKPLVLNQTNLMAVMTTWGEDTDKWINHKVKVAVVNVPFNGKNVLGIQIYPQ